MDNIREQLKEKVFSKFQKDSWEIKTIGEIATEIISGNEITRAQLGTGSFPAIKCGDINSSLPQQFKECISFVDLNLLKKPKYFEYGNLLLSNMSNKVETVGTPVVYLGEDKCLAGDHVIVIKTDQNTKFLAYILSSDYSKAQIKKLAQKSTVYDLYVSKIKQIKIPLPSLEIQRKIVEFLDKFSELERNLKIEWEKESEKRKIQYEYYRELLFNWGLREHNWPLKSIGEIANEIILGAEIRKVQVGTGNFPAIKAGDLNSGLKISFLECKSFVNPDLIKKKKYFEKGDLLISKLSNKIETLGVSAYLGNERGLLGEGVACLKHNQNPSFLSFAFESQYVREQYKELIDEGTVFNLHLSKIKQIKVPVPSLEEQERIVETLDKLYEIVHDFKEGIPFLIQKNRKRYEFYRELLLEK